MDRPFPVFAGIDWAEDAHAVCALVDDKPINRSFPNSPKGIAELAQWLASLAPAPEDVAVAIEVPHGPVVEGLILRGFSLFAINPKQLDRHRDRYSIAGAKDDRRDAFVLAHSLSLHQASFQPISLLPEAIIELKTATRLRTRLVRTRGRLANQLRSELLVCAPHYLTLASAADEPWFWELLARLKAPGAGSPFSSAFASPASPPTMSSPFSANPPSSSPPAPAPPAPSRSPPSFPPCAWSPCKSPIPSATSARC